MTLPAFRAASVFGASDAAATAITPTMPAGVLQNDILILIVETGAVPITFSGGTETWVEMPGSPQSPAAQTNMTCFWARASQDAPTSPTSSDSGNHQFGAIIAVSGCITTGDPWDITATGTSDGGSGDTSISIVGGTTTVADCFIVMATAQDLPDLRTSAEFSGWTNADLANVTERYDESATAGNGGAIGIATGEKAASGAFGATTATSATSSARACYMVALKPPAGGGTTTPQTLALGMTLTPAMSMQTGKLLALGATLTAALIRQTSKVLALGATLNAAASKTVGKILGLAATLTPASVQVKAKQQLLNLPITLTPALTRRTGKALSLGVSFVPALVRRIGKALGLGATFAPTMDTQSSVVVASQADLSAQAVTGDQQGQGSTLDVSGQATAGDQQGQGVTGDTTSQSSGPS